MTFYSALHYAAKAEKSAIAAKESAAKASQASGETIQLGFDGSMEDGRLVFKHAPSGVEIPYDLLNNYEYEIDMAYNSLDSLSDDLQMVVRNGSDVINFVSSLHRSSTESMKIVDMKQVMRFNTSTGYRWLFKVSYRITPAGDKVFLLYPVVTNTSTLDETIAGQKTFTSYPIIATDTSTKLRIKAQTLDIDTNPEEQKNNQIWFIDKNDNHFAVLQAIQSTSGSISLSLTLKSKSANSYSTLNIIQEADGRSYASAPTPDSTANGTAIATSEWVNDKLFLDVTKRTTLSVSLNKAFTITNNGYLALSIKVGSQTDAKVNILLVNSGTANSSSYTVCTITHNGGTAESNTVPVIIPVKKGQSVYLNYNNAGSASVMSAYLFRNV